VPDAWLAKHSLVSQEEKEMKNLAELVEKRARAVTEMRSYLEKGDTAKFDEINLEVEKVDAEIENIRRIEAVEKAQAAFDETKAPALPNLGAAASADAEFQAKYETAFQNYLRKGENRLSAEDRTILSRVSAPIKAAQTETTTGGGYLIPQGFSGKLEIALKAFGGILGVCDEFTTETGNPLPWPTTDDTAQEGEILGVNTVLNEADFVFGQVVFGAFTHNSKSVLIPLQLMQDSYFNLNDEVSRLLGTRLGRGMNRKLTTGVGTTEPSGIVTETVAAGNVYTTTAGQTSTIIGDDLIELEHKVDPAYRPNGKYMFNDGTLKAIKKLKDSYGRYLWLPGLAVSDPNTINGYEYVINQHMADLGRTGSPLAGNVFALFGDMKKYKVRRVADVMVMVLRERYADYLQVGYQAFMRYDGKLMDAGTHPIAAAKQAAS
jgi:HK97 family phage major capsid protein